MLYLLKSGKIVNTLRNYRKYHRWIGVFLSMFILISSLTGILLSWKKQSDLIQPPTQLVKQETNEPWLAIEEMEMIASRALKKHQPEIQNKIDRIDIRPGKGVAKVLFEQGYWEVQLDGYNGGVLSVERRYSDLIEQLHDGSFFGENFKLLAMNVLGTGLVVMVITGLVLWYCPKIVRKRKKHPFR
ncbi:DNA mismatch repair protein [Echinicola strongylocentroti]|uniref:DNA mismatch repair protein n=1 Tax=Echinicola strongylocentroti TaxID=1795355 RepID=A0A2Z4IMK5_9BACT|nr:PepSY-associated TM helix domain-containing protein [Echinicola strongylocentroti]AWW32135.1 DNA mismatch repair protein [Echinicola strongylocentroti]